MFNHLKIRLLIDIMTTFKTLNPSIINMLLKSVESELVDLKTKDNINPELIKHYENIHLNITNYNYLKELTNDVFYDITTLVKKINGLEKQFIKVYKKANLKTTKKLLKLLEKSLDVSKEYRDVLYKQNYLYKESIRLNRKIDVDDIDKIISRRYDEFSKYTSKEKLTEFYNRLP